MNLIELAETGLIPDRLVRSGIRGLLRRRLRDSGGQNRQPAADFAAQLRDSPLAVETDAANDQHYEVPAEFFQHVLGFHLKYSCCYFHQPQSSLDEAEQDMLWKTCQRAEIEDGMRVLELGCGWGSLSLWMAEQFPQCQVTAVSNSASQRRFIEGRAAQRQVSNLRVISADMRDFEIEARFDRVISVEMFEHMRNYELLMQRVAGWLAEDGKAFVHVFCHRHTPYLFQTEGATNWMGRHFFTGGMMPSEDLLGYFDEDLRIEHQWRVNGLHYWRTCEAWLKNLDRHRAVLKQRFRQDMSLKQAKRSLQRWRMFFMACAELFRYRNGSEWFVSHYLLQKSCQASNQDGRPADELVTG